MAPLFSSGRYAAVTSTVALVAALGSGTAYAAGLITSKDIKDGGVRRADLATGAVDSRKVADRSLTSRDFKAGQLPAGRQGPTGPRGPAGPQGPAGTGGELELVYVRTGPLSADVGVSEVYLFCPDGLSPTSGGFSSNASSTLGMHGSFPFDDPIMMSGGGDPDNIPDNGWAIQVDNDGEAAELFAAYAVCASASYVGDAYVVVSPAQTTTRRTGDRTVVVARPPALTGQEKD